ncbi:MAG: alanine--tRNA ligase [Bdellovibrionales bacterium RIFOXYB1_FULL_37_110]|nr:MAG: alanine--tRNA ligase [Bdellovibrionales bacterium RIFOXYA1_FULL_38_20]OFZ51134.1 MAG: alanine--tRNA ligase [Bdellovibrionales bacterium RIFOXYC1_FULL_37_79]OFZ61241.1 MAG: alanine--tRNA ligase [Bdellovibrionales bacterium RIFOXYB1_FULL_37_110]OFZ62104.1 MAG: alanine--tRNA ligase [Bdellovibrionales bacterium RIFOXYD1_FULL_36_51]
MKSNEIRNNFIKYFQDKSHKHMPSSSLVPINDPTLLFANAGMNQFKDYFTGKSTPQDKRAVTIQKCVRAGGKHNDLDNVGFTARHHTFFEMLGNFSFGDYFKEDAIFFAWEFLTKTLQLPKNKLYITVHESDEEALLLWPKVTGINKDRIFKKGDKDNFWEMGEFGPCGPCSEIFFDHGEKFCTPGFKPGTNQNLLDDEQRYVEIWNLVFMQYEKNKEGRFPLPRPSIDTGAGLERIAAALQEKYWNYDTDLFTPIISKIQNLTGKDYSDKRFCGHIRVVADHIRSTSMLITDGVIPSNEGRGYVLRRIIRRAVRHLRELEAPGGSFYKLAPAFFETIRQSYPENAKNISMAEKFIKLEEEKFYETLETGLKFLNQELTNNLVNQTLSGETIFKLYDTFGFPFDLTETILKEKNLAVDHDGFNRKMEEQRNLSKKSWKGNLEIDDKIFYELKEKFGNNHFSYDQLTLEAKLLEKRTLGDHDLLIFDYTPFYGESGGQTGDSGSIMTKDNVEIAQVLNTIKPLDDFTVLIAQTNNKLNIKESYILKVNVTKRNLTARNHTATHLLHAALGKVLGDHVHQAGSLVTDERLRFDFTHPKGLTNEELDQVASIVNQSIANQIPVSTKKMNTKEATASGAKALFGEKYGEHVRVISIKNENDPPVSVELCGGTHIKNTSEIGLFVIVSEGALSTGIRRIEALTSTSAFKYLHHRSKELSKIELMLKTRTENVYPQIEKQIKELKTQYKEIQSLKEKIQSMDNKHLFDQPEMLKNLYPFKAVLAPDNTDLRKLSDEFISKYQNGFIFIAMNRNDKMTVLLRAGSKAPKIICPDILNSIIMKFGGKSGGRPDMAQGACDKFEVGSVGKKLGEALEKKL